MIHRPGLPGLLLLGVTITAHALAPSLARADPGVSEDHSIGAPDSETRASYGAVTVGWLAGLTGPLELGLAAEVEFFPAALDRHGLGLYYRSDSSGDQGMLTAGVSYEAGATRPKFVLSLHADAGATHGPAHPVLGAGVRSQLTIWHPLVIASNATAHLIIDGTDSRLALAITFTAGISR